MNKIIINKNTVFQCAGMFLDLLKDKAVIYGISNKIWIFISSAVTAPLIIIFFSPALQGYYYTFTGLLGIQTLFVMGLGQLVQQFVSHEWIKIKYDPVEGLKGDEISLQRLAAIKRFTLRWFSAMSLILFIGLSLGGYIFMSNAAGPASVNLYEWLIPWFVICFLKSFQILLSPGLSFLEGINEVESVNRFRFSQSVSERIASWIVMLIGGKLWLFSVGTGVNLFGQLNFFNRKFFRLLKNIFSLKATPNKIWKNEILPLQWRYALSSLSGYLNFSFLIPLIFWFSGPVIAGQAGITWAVITMFWGLSVTVVSTKMPELAMNFANGDFKKVNKTFYSSTISSTLLLTFSVILFYSVLLFLMIASPGVAGRFLDPVTALIFSVSIIPHHLRFAMASYMRIMKKEPFWNISILESILVIIVLPFACKIYGVTGLAAGFLIIISLMTFLTLYIFRKFKP